MIYRHYKGGRYTIIATGILESTFEPMVVYQGVGGGQVWVRPTKDFFGVASHNGGLVRRFEEEKSNDG